MRIKAIEKIFKTGTRKFLIDDPSLPPEVSLCPCGSMTVMPTNITWRDWILPRVWKFAYLRVRGLA